MIGNYALAPIATDRLHVLQHILFLLTPSCLFLAVLSSGLSSYAVLLKQPSHAKSQTTSTPTTLLECVVG